MSQFEKDGEEAKASAFEGYKAEAREKYGKFKLKELVVEMKKVGGLKESVEDKLSKINAHYDVLRMERVPEQMELDGVETIRYEGIGKVVLTGDMFVSTKKGQMPALQAWFKKNRLGDLLKPSINSSTLKAWVKARMVAGKKVPSELLSITPVTRASITKG